MGWEPGALSFSFGKEFAIAHGPAEFQVRELFPSTSSVWSSRDAMGKRENPMCHFELSSVTSVLCRARFSPSILPCSWNSRAHSWLDGALDTALHFPLVAGAPGRAEPGQGGSGWPTLFYLGLFPSLLSYFHGNMAGYRHQSCLDWMWEVGGTGMQELRSVRDWESFVWAPSA